MNLRIDYDASQRLFTINTGKVLVSAISEWLGWRRTTSGSYVAPAWPTSVLSVNPSPSAVVTWSAEASQERDAILKQLGSARGSLTSKPFARLKPAPTERVARQHQWQAFEALRHMSYRALLADDMGLGKTSSALWAAHDAGVQRILVVCPVSVKFNWENEIRETLSSQWDVTVIDGTSKQRASQLAEARALMALRAIIINYDLLLHLTDEQSAWLHEFASKGMVLFDESHYVKNRIAKRTLECHGIAAHAKYVCCLTGTPIRNMADDLFSQVELVRPGTWTSYRDFAKRYLVINTVKFGKRQTQKIVGTKNLTELNAVMNTLQIKRSKAEAIDLPPKIRTYPELELEGDLRRLYAAMKDFARIQLRDLTVVANVGSLTSKHGVPLEKSDYQSGRAMSIWDPRAKSAVEQAMRCEQIAQGFIGGIPDPVMAKLGPDILRAAEKIPGRPNELIFPHAPKILWLLEAIEAVLAQGGAPIVFSRFNAPMVWLNKELMKRGILNGFLNGSLSSIAKSGIVSNFQGGDGIKVLLCQVEIAEGWNAHRSQDVLFLGRDWSPQVNTQAEDRAHRMGQKGTVNVQIPIVRRTIEVMLDKRLRAKDADANQALRSVTIEELMEAL